MLANSELPKFLWEELMFTVEVLGTRALHSAIDIPVKGAARDGS